MMIWSEPLFKGFIYLWIGFIIWNYQFVVYIENGLFGTIKSILEKKGTSVGDRVRIEKKKLCA